MQIQQLTVMIFAHEAAQAWKWLAIMIGMFLRALEGEGDVGRGNKSFFVP